MSSLTSETPQCKLPSRVVICFSSAGVRLVREMPQDDLHAALKHCVALVNSSVSEGMSAAILEVTVSPGPREGAGETACRLSPREWRWCLSQ